MEQQKGIVKYEARNGQEVNLDPDIVKKFLVRGNPEFVTKQELVMFMGICKARGLDPFAGDVYLIKYTRDDPAAIVTSIDYFRSRAKAQPDCHGWQAGIIVQGKAGEIKKTAGLMLEGEKLVGGWFKAQPKGWDYPFELEVNLSGYIKKTKSGETTRFWKPENQPTMIRKVAESQGLRELWPTEFQGVYGEEEAPGPPIDLKLGNGYSAVDEGAVKEFDAQAAKWKNKAFLPEYMEVCSEHFGKPIPELKESIVADNAVEAFVDSLDKWVNENKSPKRTAKKAQAAPKEPDPIPDMGEGEIVQGGPETEATERLVKCPKDGQEAVESYCRDYCKPEDRAECGVWK